MHIGKRVGRTATALATALGAAALLPAPAGSAELEIGNPQRLAVAAGELPPQYPLEQKLLQFTPGAEASKAFRDKIARHADRPLLVVVVPDTTAGQASHPRLVWFGNLLRSADPDVQRMLGLVDVVPAVLRDIQTVVPDARADVLCYLVGLRDGRPFAWPMSVTTPTEAAFVQALAGNVIRGGNPDARAKSYWAGLADRERERIQAAVRDLGADEYLKRESASRSLARRMPDAAPYVLSALNAAKDPEVRSRCSELLTLAGRSWLTKPPSGCVWVQWHGGRIGAVPLRGNVVNVGAVVELKAVPAPAEVVLPAVRK